MQGWDRARRLCQPLGEASAGAGRHGSRNHRMLSSASPQKLSFHLAQFLRRSMLCSLHAHSMSLATELWAMSLQVLTEGRTSATAAPWSPACGLRFMPPWTKRLPVCVPSD